MKTMRQSIGRIGESRVSDYLKAQRYKVIERNYLKKWGEIDLIAIKDEVYLFVEVKTVTRSYICNTKMNNVDKYKAESNIHLSKTERLKRTIQTYLANVKSKREVEWQFDVFVVVLNKEDLEMQGIERIENVIL